MLQNWKSLDPRVAKVKTSATHHPAYNYTYAITWWFALGVFPAPVMIILSSRQSGVQIVDQTPIDHTNWQQVGKMMYQNSLKRIILKGNLHFIKICHLSACFFNLPKMK